jgi:hypothetical protein
MTLTLMEKNEEKVVAIKVGGKLTSEDYAVFTPEIERLIDVYGKI